MDIYRHVLLVTALNLPFWYGHLVVYSPYKQLLQSFKVLWWANELEDTSPYPASRLILLPVTFAIPLLHGLDRKWKTIEENWIATCPTVWKSFVMATICSLTTFPGSLHNGSSLPNQISMYSWYPFANDKCFIDSDIDEFNKRGTTCIPKSNVIQL